MIARTMADRPPIRAIAWGAFKEGTRWFYEPVVLPVKWLLRLMRGLQGGNRNRHDGHMQPAGSVQQRLAPSRAVHQTALRELVETLEKRLRELRGEERPPELADLIQRVRQHLLENALLEPQRACFEWHEVIFEPQSWEAMTVKFDPPNRPESECEEAAA